MSAEQLENLFSTLKQTLASMTRLGGRSTEKDLIDQSGGYTVSMCPATAASPCPRCGGRIVKEAYSGGNVYFCTSCQLKT